MSQCNFCDNGSPRVKLSDGYFYHETMAWCHENGLGTPSGMGIGGERVYIAIEYNEEEHRILGVFSTAEAADDCALYKMRAEAKEQAENDLLEGFPPAYSYTVGCWEIGVGKVDEFSPPLRREPHITE